MAKKAFGIFWVLVILLGGVGVSFGVVTPPVGRIVAIEGKVMILHSGEKEPEVARLMAEVYLMDRIETMERSKVKILMKDESVITLSEKTELHINEFVFSPVEKERRSVFKMLRGKTKFLVGRLMGFRSHYRVDTPTATIGIRGTLFIVWTAIDSAGRHVTFVLPLEGSLDTNAIGIPDKIVEVNAGNVGQIGMNVPPTYTIATEQTIQQALQGTDVLLILPRDKEVLDKMGIPPREINEIRREVTPPPPPPPPPVTIEPIRREPPSPAPPAVQTLPRPPLPPSY
jgi:hypothetical protein